ncbi:MAG TPA: response regulator transcription factor [Verrucomicrobiae bacterium]|jgi:DNA-binding NarL/FixJ family response regulator|nr:response regulator transcription factor [Verrucomicrobiae bacterium]
MQPASTAISTTTPSSSLTRVVLVEDQKALCKQWLEIIDSFDDFECVGTCESAEEAIERTPQLRPNIILMDIRLPQMSGIECTWRLKELLPATPIVILTVVDDDDLIFRALEAGADGYLLKWAPPADLRAALLDVLNGGAPMSSVIAHRVVRSFKQPSRSHSNVQLSARETEILKLLSKGYYNKEIADDIGLSIETVRTYLKGIYRKLHVRSRAEAIVWYGAGNQRLQKTAPGR